MDPATIVGVVGALSSVVAMLYMEGSTIGAILLPSPMILVFGGTIFATMASFTIKDTIYALSPSTPSCRCRERHVAKACWPWRTPRKASKTPLCAKA